MDETEPTAGPGDDETAECEAAGLRRAGRRALTARERRAIRGRAHWLWAQFAGAVLAFWVVLFAALGTAVFVGEAEGAARLVSSLVTLLLFAGTVVLFLAARLFLSDSRALSRDGRRGYVQRFTGALPPADAVGGRLQWLEQAGLLKRDRAAPQWFEVLPHFGLPLAGERRSAAPLYPVHAAPSGRGRRDARLRRSRRGMGGAGRVGRRADPGGSAGTLPRRGAGAAAAASPCVAGAAALADPGQPVAWHRALARAARRRSAARVRLGLLARPDLLPPPGSGGPSGRLGAVPEPARSMAARAGGRLGRVVIVRAPLQEDEAAAAAARLTLELLPLSEAVWTIDGEPAGWRTMG